MSKRVGDQISNGEAPAFRRPKRSRYRDRHMSKLGPAIRCSSSVRRAIRPKWLTRACWVSGKGCPNGVLPWVPRMSYIRRIVMSPP